MGDYIKFVADEIGIVKFKGLFDLNGMLRMMHSYLKHQGYDFFERKHKAKIPELELGWECEKKVTGYEMYRIEIDFHFYDLRQVEIEENGVKRKMTDGRFIITFGGGIERGYNADWEDKKDPWKERLKNFYEQITKREWMVKHARTLVLEVAGLRDKTNSYLGMVTSF